jgi:hypothetical protein
VRAPIRQGVSRFQLLQRRGVDPRTRPVYAVFDCLRTDKKPTECTWTAREP